jgi:hypothetical protein
MRWATVALVSVSTSTAVPFESDVAGMDVTRVTRVILEIWMLVAAPLLSVTVIESALAVVMWPITVFRVGVGGQVDVAAAAAPPAPDAPPHPISSALNRGMARTPPKRAVQANDRMWGLLSMRLLQATLIRL